MAGEEKTPKHNKIKNSQNKTQKMVKILIKKCISIPIIQVSFVHKLIISVIKSIEINVKTIVKITDGNTGM